MKRTFVNALDLPDYSDIQVGVDAVKHVTSVMKSKGVRIEIPTEHRYWEYGSAVQALLDYYGCDRAGTLTVLDVGSGWGALGPTLAYCYGVSVIECEPDIGCRTSRILCNKELAANGKPQIQVLSTGIGSLPDTKFDAVFCISVMEHLRADQELGAWMDLIAHVKPNGLFFSTVDCVPKAGQSYVFDNLREQNFTPELIKQRVEYLKAEGMVPMGVPDYAYHGSHVHGSYTFFRIGMLRNSL